MGADETEGGVDAGGSPTFFVDRSGDQYGIRDALAQLGLGCEILDELFDQNTPDPVWLERAGANGWPVLSRDRKIRKRRLEIAAVRRARVALFVLVASGVAGPEEAEIYVAAAPSILRFLERNAPPFIAKVYRGGRVKLWMANDPATGEFEYVDRFKAAGGAER